MYNNDKGKVLAFLKHALREQWLKGEELDHTSRQIAPPPHQLLVLHPASGTRATFHIPDLAGETFAAQFVTRSFPHEFVERIQQAAGLILFLHCDQQANHALNIHPTFMDPTPANEGSADTAPAENHGREWQLEDACRQVKLVELLQFIAEILGNRPPIRIAVAISAWDLVEKAPRILEAEMPKEPARFFLTLWPLIDQFLQGNGESFAYHIFGVSARGGGITPSEIARLTHFAHPPDRILVVDGVNRSSDLTKPVRWILGLLESTPISNA